MVEIATRIQDKDKLLAAIAYAIPILGGLIILLTDAGKDPAMKFHAMQSIVLGVIVWILSFVCVGVLFWLYCLYGAYVIYTSNDFQSFIASFVKDNLMK
jgi:hypothetical protein